MRMSIIVVLVVDALKADWLGAASEHDAESSRDSEERDFQRMVVRDKVRCAALAEATRLNAGTWPACTW